MRGFLVVFLLSVSAPQSLADEISYDVAIQNSSGTLTQFDPNLGELSGISYSGNLNFGVEVSAYPWYSGFPGVPVNWGGSTNLNVDGLSIDGPVLSGTSTISGWGGGFAAGWGGGAWNEISGYIPGSMNGDFVGSGAMDISTQWNVTDNSAWLWYKIGIGNPACNGDLTFTYNYVGVPEPSRLIMDGIALLELVPIYFLRRH